jgi:hypothetical protein
MGITYTFHVMIGAEVPDELYSDLLGLDDPDLFTNPWPNQPVYVTASSMGGGPTILGIDLVPPMGSYDEDELVVQDLEAIDLEAAKEQVKTFAAQFGLELEPKLLSFVEPN